MVQVRFKLDENLPAEMAHLFSRAGHDAVTVLEQGLGGRGMASFDFASLRSGRTVKGLSISVRPERSEAKSKDADYSGTISCGVSDPDLATICVEERRAIITLDIDFSDIRAYRPSAY